MSNPPSGEISSIDDYTKRRNMRNHPTYARFRRFRDKDRACVRLGQHQFAVAANKGRSKPALGGTELAPVGSRTCRLLAVGVLAAASGGVQLLTPAVERLSYSADA